AAIKSALTAKVSEQKFIVIDDLSVPEIKTKRIVGLLDSFKLNKALVVTTEKNEMVSASAKNIPDVRTTESGSINVFDIMKYDTVVIAKDAVKKIEEVYA
ncbi:MAG: 50S ribosomal protein L4, partial [Lachnospiraceae bacterium]|nr:50S ribosomal protein L4 [Lachnospiraceae bacterium]